MSDIVPAGNGSADPVTALLMRAATDPSFDAAKFDTAVKFLREREARAEHSAFNEAMARAAAEMQVVPKNASNDYLKSRYATLPGMLAVIKPITSSHGLNFRFGTEPHPDPAWMTITCTISLGNYSETTALPGPILSGEGIKGGKTQMNALQAVGGTVTYLSRYLLGMVFTLIQHMPDIIADDDGGDPTRKPYQGSPASRPPYQTGTGQPQGGATATNGNGAVDRTAVFLDRLQAALNGAQTMAEVEKLDAQAKTWLSNRAGTPPTTVTDAITRMVHMAIARVNPDTVVAPDALALMAEIAIMDQEFLDALPTDPAFNQRMLALSEADGDRVTDAIKARAEALAEAQP
jgi:hypothetical protein